MVIYKITNLLNGKIYVGKDSKNNPNYYGSGELITKAIKKYGKENFNKEILEVCSSLDELNEREKFWITQMDSRNKKIGYNIAEGGNGGILWNGDAPNTGVEFSEIHKYKISNSLSGRVLSDGHKNNISLNHADVSGENNPMFGKKHTDEVKNIISKTNKGRKLSKETKVLMSKQKLGDKNNNSKLSEKDVLEIRFRYHNSDVSLNDLAQMFGVGKACIHKIITYKTWIHL